MADQDTNGDEHVEEETIEIDEKTLGTISDQVGEKLGKELTEQIATQMAEKQQELLDKYLEKTEETRNKEIGDQGEEDAANDPIAKGLKAKLFSEQVTKESKEMRLFKAARALSNNDMQTVKEYNHYAVAARQKAGYANEGNDTDGGALVPDPEFDTTIYENLPKYGVAFANADVRSTDRNEVRFVTLDSGLEFYATAEAGVKTSAKMDFSKQLVELQKYAVIVPSTDELTEDAAIDFWNLVTRELSRAYAKKADEVTFTHATSGITNTTGVLTEPTSGAGTTLTWDDLLVAEGKPEDGFDSSNAKWFMRRETWFALVRTKYDAGGGASTGGYYFNPDPHNPTTPWGTPVVFTRVLPKATEVNANDGFAVYGDLRNYVLYNKRGMALTVLKEATIVDADDANFNLATQDGTALRAVVRMLGKLPKGNAGKFVVVGTGTVS